MLSNKTFKRVVAFLFALFALVFVGYRVYSYLYAPYETETALMYTAQDVITADGIMVKTEDCLSGPSNTTDEIHYLIKNGGKAAKNETVAVVYNSKEDLDTQYKIEALDEKINMLKSSQEQGSTTQTHTDTINQQIYEKVIAIASAVAENSFSSIPSDTVNLNVYLNRRNIITKKDSGYDAQISLLEAEKSSLTDSLSSTGTKIVTEKSGYFSNVIDGFENKFNYKTVSELNTDKLEKIISDAKKQSADEKFDSSYVGKIIDSYKWNFAVVVSQDYSQKLREGNKVTLNFPYLSMAGIPATVHSVEKENKSGKIKVIFSSDYFNDTIVNMRFEVCDIVSGEYTGLRISKDALRFKDNVKGVYIEYNNVLLFRKIAVLYETEDYVICDASAQNENNELALYDEVVTKGVDLYEQKHAG